MTDLKRYRLDCADGEWTPYDEAEAALLQARADAAAAQAAMVERVTEIVRIVWGRCEALEDEAADKLASSEELTDHEIGFWRGQKSVAKSIRRSTEMPTLAPDAGTAELARLRGERDAAVLLKGHAATAAALLRNFGISESVAEYLEKAVAEFDEAAEVATWPPDMQARYRATVAMRARLKPDADGLVPVKKVDQE